MSSAPSVASPCLNSFTWSHALDNASASLEGNTPSPQDGNNIAADYGQSDYNLPISDVTSFIYELPVGRGREFLSNANGFVDAALGGWQVSVINTMQSGTPFNLTYGPSSANQVSPQITASFRGLNLYRPNVIPGVQQKLNTQIASSGFIQYVNPAAFALPATGTAAAPLSPFGNASRNPLRNTAFYQTDFALNKKVLNPGREPQGSSFARSSTTCSTTPICIFRPPLVERTERRPAQAASSAARLRRVSSSSV